jgi:putative peptide maturation system protein
LNHAKFLGLLGFIEAAADGALIRQAATRDGITVSDGELQQAADQFRAARELHGAEETRSWLAARYLSFAEWESMLEAEVIGRKLRGALTEGEVERHFAVNRLAFDTAEVSQLVVRDEGVARELRAQIVEDGADFHALARQHSIDEATRKAGGYLGPVKRGALAAAAQAAVFGGREGEVVGPVKTDEGWKLIKVEALQPATLNEATREEIKSMLFHEWLAEQRSREQISVPMFAAGSRRW